MQVTIPDMDTTYWCQVGILPTEVQEQERYIYKVCRTLICKVLIKLIELRCLHLPFKAWLLSLQFSPEISSESGYVHHVLLYICAALNHTFVGASGVCDDTHLAIQSCRGSEVIAGWAVGGTVSLFHTMPVTTI